MFVPISTNKNRMNNLKKIYVGFLALNTLMQIGAGMLMISDFKEVVTSMFHLNYTENMKPLGQVLASNVFFFAGILILSIIWIFKRQSKGVSLAVFFGWFIMIAGTISYLSQGVIEGLTMDLPRGLIIIIMGYLIQRQDKKSSFDKNDKTK